MVTKESFLIAGLFGALLLFTIFLAAMGLQSVPAIKMSIVSMIFAYAFQVGNYWYEGGFLSDSFWPVLAVLWLASIASSGAALYILFF